MNSKQKTKTKTKKNSINQFKSPISSKINRQKIKRKTAEGSLLSIFITFGILILVIALIVLKRNAT